MIICFEVSSRHTSARLLMAQPHPEFRGLWSRSEQKNAKICPPPGITTKSGFVFTQPGPTADRRVHRGMSAAGRSRRPSRGWRRPGGVAVRARSRGVEPAHRRAGARVQPRPARQMPGDVPFGWPVSKAPHGPIALQARWPPGEPQRLAGAFFCWEALLSPGGVASPASPLRARISEPALDQRATSGLRAGQKQSGSRLVIDRDRLAGGRSHP